jgi:hypothetical protein
MREYMKRRWRLRRQVAIAFLGKKCVRCGRADSKKRKLEFDHIDRLVKKHTVAKLTSINEIAFWKEIKKCQLLCTPCHKEKSRPEQVRDALQREARKRRSKRSGS